MFHPQLCLKGFFEKDANAASRDRVEEAMAYLASDKDGDVRSIFHPPALCDEKFYDSDGDVSVSCTSGDRSYLLNIKSNQKDSLECNKIHLGQSHEHSYINKCSCQCNVNMLIYNIRFASVCTHMPVGSSTYHIFVLQCITICNKLDCLRVGI